MWRFSSLCMNTDNKTLTREEFYNSSSRRLVASHSWRTFHHLFQHRHSISASEKTILVPLCCISTTTFRNTEATAVRPSWIGKIKEVFTGTKTPEARESQSSAVTFTLENYADELKKARKLGSLAQFVRGRGGEVTMSEAFEKQEAIIRVLASYDSSGEHLESKHKVDAAKHCNCTIFDVENALAKYTWAKAAQKKIDKLKEEGKPMPKSLAEVQEMVGSTPMDMANSNLAKSGQISRNAFCPCGSKKKYKKCCGKT